MIAEKVFAEGVAKDIRNYLPPEYENAEFQVVQKNKNNGVQLIGVQVNLPGKDLSPIIYVEQFFDEIRQGEPVEQVMNRFARCIEQSSRAPFMNSDIDLMNYDSLKEHLAIKIVNTKANQKMLQEMPHENIEDLSAICYVNFPVDSREGKATMQVRNEHLNIWNIDEKELFQQARVNKQLVNIEHVTAKMDVEELKTMIEEHVAYTNSEIGKKILEHFTDYLPKFKKIIPADYEKMMTTILQLEEQGMSSEQAKIEAFYMIKEGR